MLYNPFYDTMSKPHGSVCQTDSTQRQKARHARHSPAMPEHDAQRALNSCSVPKTCGSPVPGTRTGRTLPFTLRFMTARTPRIVLAIDPGSVVTGWSVIESQGNRVTLRASGVIRAGRQSLTGRLELLYTEISGLIATHSPTEGAIEGLYVHRHADAALKLGHARAAALLAMRHGGLSITAYEPSVVKKSVTGTGRATKEQVHAMVSRLVREPIPGPLDASDAVAIGLCHLQQNPRLRRGPL